MRKVVPADVTRHAAAHSSPRALYTHGLEFERKNTECSYKVSEPVSRNGYQCIGLQYLDEHNSRLTSENADGLETFIFNKTGDHHNRHKCCSYSPRNSLDHLCMIKSSTQKPTH